MIQEWIDEVKTKSPKDQLGMILVHNGIVRATSKDGKPVREMYLTFDEGLLDKAIARFKETEGVVDIKVWVNQGICQLGTI